MKFELIATKLYTRIKTILAMQMHPANRNF